MDAIRSVLLPLDLTENIEKLASTALTMVDKFEAQLHVLFVVSAFQYVADIHLAGDSIDAFEAEVVAGGRQKMDEVIKTHFGHLPHVRSEVLLGDVSDTILKYIDEHQIDMVVMGTHGRRGFGRVIFGSVAQRVVKWAHVPVLVINPFEPKA